GDTLLSVNDVPLVVPIWEKRPPKAPVARWTWYWVAPLEPFQDRETEFEPALAVRLVGAAGGVGPGPPPPSWSSTASNAGLGWKLSSHSSGESNSGNVLSTQDCPSCSPQTVRPAQLAVWQICTTCR